MRSFPAVLLCLVAGAALAQTPADDQADGPGDGAATDLAATDLAATDLAAADVAAADLAAEALVSDARDQFMAGDHAAALAVLAPLAEAGHPRAQNLLGSAYQYGMGVAQDVDQAQIWFLAAAGQGYPPALHNLGVLLEHGASGTPADPAGACDWYHQAAALDYGPSMSGWGACLFDGIAGVQNRVEALRVFQRGADLGNASSLNWMGWLTRTGEGGAARDPEAALRYYSAAAWLGNAGAQNALGEMLEGGEGGTVDLGAAMDWYRRAIGNDVAYAGINAAWMTFENPGIFPDRVQGVAYCLWAAAAAEPDMRARYRSDCETEAADLSADERRRAEKLALGL